MERRAPVPSATGRERAISTGHADDATGALLCAERLRGPDLVIAEVGARFQPDQPGPDAAARAAQVERAPADLADRLCARCRVNSAGSRGARWDGPPGNLRRRVRPVVETVRGIIDAVRPTRTHYAWRPCPGSLTRRTRAA